MGLSKKEWIVSEDTKTTLLQVWMEIPRGLSICLSATTTSLYHFCLDLNPLEM